MSTDFKAGLDSDELDGLPSAANPLTAMGIDPDEARANPDILAQIQKGTYNPLEGVDKRAANPALSAPPVQSSPSPAPSATAAGKAGGAGATPDSSEPNDPEGYGMAGLSQLNKSMQKADQAVDEVPTQTPQEITDLSARRSKLATPAPRFDPATGKELTSTQEYNPQTGEMDTINPKASTGQKVWRGVRGGLVGLLTGGIPGAIVGGIEPQDIAGGKGYKDPSKQYEQAEQRREQALASTDTDLGNARSTWKEAVEASKAKSGELRANATLGKDLTTGATGLINAEENTPEKEQKKGEAKLALSQAEFDQRQKQLQTDPQLSKLSPLNKMLYMANGKVPDPRDLNEAEVNAAQIAKAMTVYKAQHGGKMPQNLEDFNAVIASAKGDLDRGKGKGPTDQQLRTISDKKAAGIEKANTEFAKKKFMPGSREDYQRQLQEVQNAFEEEMGDIGKAGPHNNVLVDPKGQVTWKPETPAALPTTPAPAASAAQTPTKPQPAPDGTRVQGKDGKTKVKQGGKWVDEQSGQ
jgi:hypothetical protein